jgi:hypothetical protein
MKSVCVILLDTSSSMAGGFEGEPQKPSSENDKADTKIGTAKKCLLAALDSPPSTEIVLVTFDVDARVVLRTSSVDTKQMKDLVARIKALARNIHDFRSTKGLPTVSNR